MFCYQCEQTAKGQGCEKIGVCGKTQDVSNLQDLLLYNLVGVAVLKEACDRYKLDSVDVAPIIIQGLFTTVTNVNFDPKRVKSIIDESSRVKESLKRALVYNLRANEREELMASLPKLVEFEPEKELDKLVAQSEKCGIFADTNLNEDIRSLREILKYGIKGMAAYAHHAKDLGYQCEDVNAFFVKSMASLADDSLDIEALLGLVLECGERNLRCMEILDQAHTETFGHPVPTEVFLGVKKGPAILVSGHDLKALKFLLDQTQGSGINIYTHGEMLPAHGYPELKKYKHLVGNYGGAWQDQQKEFVEFPGAILMTTNCIQKPRDEYCRDIFTTDLVAWPGVEHILGADFRVVIDRAKKLDGFKEDREDKKILVGFGHNAVLGVADKVVTAVKAGKIKHFYLIGGCDGAKSGRNYYTELAEAVPKDAVILTLACGKFRFNKQDFGDIDGIPRLLDIGQCNDAYSAIKIASALADAFECTVNELPLSLILSWYEQKAVCILLSLLSLGIKNIKLGPSLPAFVSANVLQVLVDKFGIQPISTVENDLG
jgi:hydroxylamine reductase